MPAKRRWATASVIEGHKNGSAACVFNHPQSPLEIREIGGGKNVLHIRLGRTPPPLRWPVLERGVHFGIFHGLLQLKPQREYAIGL